MSEIRLVPVARAEIDTLCQQFHYSRRGPAGTALRIWGVYLGEDLIGGVSYNLPNRNVCDYLFGPEVNQDPETGKNIWRVRHMNRLVLTPDAPKNAASQVISQSLKELRKTNPEVWAVVTYADEGMGHVGGIYQATNALYTGPSSGKKVRYTDPVTGAQIPTRGRNGWIPVATARANGWEVSSVLRHRYVYLLGSRPFKKHLRSLMKWKVQPYPETPQDVRRHIFLPSS